MKRTPMLPRNPAFPSLGPTIFGAVAFIAESFHRTLLSHENLTASAACVKIRRTAMSDEKRPYRKRQRAELEAETRLRITESAVALHGSIGPARTTMSAIADHAGVRRSTLYRHFPDEAAVFAACSSHWGSANPAPDPAAWAAIADPDSRLATALAELYAFYGRNEQMLANLMRDQHLVEVVAASFSRFHGYLRAVRGVLVTGRPARGRGRERTAAAIGHAVSFTTWQSLVREQGLSDEEAVQLMTRTVASAAQVVGSRARHAQERR
jgi:AcrR family transcriptional regulator